MTKPELAEYLQVSLGTIDNMVRRGLPRVKLNSAVRFDLAEVLAWAERRTQGAA